MGWFYSPQWQTRAELVCYLRSPDRFNKGLELVRACVIGPRHWYLVRELATGQHWIGLDLLKSGQGDGWGYKDLDETAGPCDVDCPLSYLDAPHAERDGFATQWRDRVRAYHAARQAKPAPVAGAWVSYGGQVYQLQRPAAPRQGWHVVDVRGYPYRMPARALTQAKPAPTDAELADAAGVTP